MLKRLTIVCAIGFSLICSIASAQNSTNSPYTRFGYGELADNTSNKNKSMGGTAIGMRSNTNINQTNPASYSSIDSLTFMYEIGATVRESKFSNQTGSYNAMSGNLDYINFQLPLGKYIAFSGGFQPFSSVGYEYTNSDSISIPTYSGSGMIYATKSYFGSGSTTQVYGGISGKIGKHLSVGVNMKYLFGSIKHQRRLAFNNNLSTINQNTYTSNTTDLSVKDINFRYGLQYYTTIKTNHLVTAGIILETKSGLGGSYSSITSTESQTPDTLSKDNGSDFETPFTLGFGVSYEYKKKLTVGADVLFQNWADTHFFGQTDSLKNRTKITLGGEYRHSPNSKNYMQRMTYRMGANMASGYINVNGESPLNLGITFGLGFPAKGNKSMINLGFEYGRIGNTSSKQIQEDYYKFSLSATFNENWFFKRKIE